MRMHLNFRILSLGCQFSSDSTIHIQVIRWCSFSWMSSSFLDLCSHSNHLLPFQSNMIGIRVFLISCRSIGSFTWTSLALVKLKGINMPFTVHTRRLGRGYSSWRTDGELAAFICWVCVLWLYFDESLVDDNYCLLPCWTGMQIGEHNLHYVEFQLLFSQSWSNNVLPPSHW